MDSYISSDPRNYQQSRGQKRSYPSSSRIQPSIPVSSPPPPYATNDNDSTSYFTTPGTLNQPLSRPLAFFPAPTMSVASDRRSVQSSSTPTVIDLTDDVEEIVVRRSVSTRTQRPPQLARSDTIGLEEVIDLTEETSDHDDGLDVELEFVGMRHRSPPPPPPRRISPPRSRIERHHHRPRHANRRSMRESGLTFPILQSLGGFTNLFLQRPHIFPLEGEFAPPVLPSIMNYAHPAWLPDRAEDSASPEKVPHNPPPPARTGFTRSPQADDVLICPSCEQELVAKKIDPLVGRKPGAKAPSKKEREEHPFWVIRECGHVYCNDCFQNRKVTSKHALPKPDINFLGDPKHPLCAVGDCMVDVGHKDKWIGVFL